MRAILESTTISDQLLGSWIKHLSGNELKVMLYLALKTEGFGSAVPELGLRQIAADTNLSKKEVRNAIRLLSIHASFTSRFNTIPVHPALSSQPFSMFDNAKHCA